MRRVTYIISDIQKALAFEWIAEGIDKTKFELSFILLNPGPSPLEGWLHEKNIKVARVRCRGKRDWPLAWFRTRKLLKEWKPDLVHCHLLQANILGLSAARSAGVKTRIYTRHHSSIHHVYHKKGVFWDRFANKRATHIVAVSSVVKRILTDRENVPEKKIALIPHGFRLMEFESVPPERVRAARQKYNLPDEAGVVGVISRFTEWKGVQDIIRAFKKILVSRSQTILVLLNTSGDYKEQILSLLSTVPEKNYRLIPFEKDIPAMYKTFRVFVHVPVDDHSEAFGQTYVEALAAGVPSVFTLSGIATDFIVDGQNALVVPFRDPGAIESAVNRLLDDPALSSALARNGKESVEKKFSLDKMISSLEKLYSA